MAVACPTPGSVSTKYSPAAIPPAPPRAAVAAAARRADALRRRGRAVAHIVVEDVVRVARDEALGSEEGDIAAVVADPHGDRGREGRRRIAGVREVDPLDRAGCAVGHV